MTAAEIAALDALHAKAFAGCQRGCEGRHFSCSCGADEAVEGVLDAWPAVSAELRALRARVAELEGPLQWAMDEIDGLTRYPGSDVAAPDEQRENCYAIAAAALKGRTDD
jgi:hypothetical protein